MRIAKGSLCCSSRDGVDQQYQDTIVDLSGADLRDANLSEGRLVNTSLGVQGFLTPHVETGERFKRIGVGEYPQ
jgi:uncharacterized protein YjbI with pentapeptide repeats